MQALRNSPAGRLEPISSGPHAAELAFVPWPLPRKLTLSAELVYELDEANRSVGTLVGVAETIPNPQLLMEPLKRREAVLSSRIEGTVSSLSDLFEYEAEHAGARETWSRGSTTTYRRWRRVSG